MQKDNDTIIDILREVILKEGKPVILEGDLLKTSGLKKSDFQRKIGALESDEKISSIKRGKLTWYFLTEIIKDFQKKETHTVKEGS